MIFNPGTQRAGTDSSRPNHHRQSRFRDRTSTRLRRPAAINSDVRNKRSDDGTPHDSRHDDVAPHYAFRQTKPRSHFRSVRIRSVTNAALGRPATVCSGQSTSGMDGSRWRIAAKPTRMENPDNTRRFRSSRRLNQLSQDGSASDHRRQLLAGLCGLVAMDLNRLTQSTSPRKYWM